MKPPESAVEFEDDASTVNSEVRFLTLELMKLAARKKAPFEKILAEYIQNTCTLKHVLSSPYEEENSFESDDAEYFDNPSQKQKKKAYSKNEK